MTLVYHLLNGLTFCKSLPENPIDGSKFSTRERSPDQGASGCCRLYWRHPPPPAGRNRCCVVNGTDAPKDRSCLSWEGSGTMRRPCPPPPFLRFTFFFILLFANFGRGLVVRGGGWGEGEAQGQRACVLGKWRVSAGCGTYLPCPNGTEI